MMKRTIAALAFCLLASLGYSQNVNHHLLKDLNTCYAQSGPRIQIFSKAVKEPVKIFVISDTHLWQWDEREEPYRQYSERMSNAYHKTKHFQTGAETTPEESFRSTVALAKKNGADVIALLGDQFSYPSEYLVEQVKGILDESGIPWYYTNGNHDWHYEGMPGTEIDLREEWTQKRLSSMFKGNDHLLYSVDVKGLRLLFLDDATYEILPEQLKAFKKEMKSRKPTLVMTHIPFYFPGFNRAYGVGNPDWNATTDDNYKIERRPQWPAEGHNDVTYSMWKEMMKACRKNIVLATFAGHVHNQTTGIMGPWPQFTVDDNASGGYYEVIVEPMPDK